ncbi:MAG: HEPN domain-containing protein [Candidatus Bathyarchaeota archaeon]|nr:HEPN domain-containing protein [Candidatus Bathyarchaeota archaeon]
MSLDKLLKEGTIHKTKPNKKTIQNALTKAHKDLKVSKTLVDETHNDWAYTASYTAMQTATRAYMNHKGYRPSSSGGHVAVIKFLNAEPDESMIKKYANRFDRIRRTRHRIMYDEYDLITEKTAKETYQLANEFIALIEAEISK